MLLPGKWQICFFFIRKKKVPSVPESLLKRRQRYAAIKAVRLKKAMAEKKVGYFIPKFWL